MATEVEHAYWEYWQPGKNVQIAEPDQADYERYVRKASRPTSMYRLLLLAMAADAWPILDIYGEGYSAQCISSIETLARRTWKSRSTIKRIVAELAEWGELEVMPCDGKCGRVTYYHSGTNHYLLPLPLGAQPWGRKNKRTKRENSSTSSSKRRRSSTGKT